MGTKQLLTLPDTTQKTVSPTGDKIVLSTRNGDIDLYTMNIDGGDVATSDKSTRVWRRQTFFSQDGKKLVFQANRPKGEEEVNTYNPFSHKDW